MPDSVLIVDDDPVQRRLLEAAMGKFGYSPVLAEGGEAAMQALEERGQSGIGVVVLDLVMPGMDGLAVMERMRALEIDIPVIVQTAKGGIDTAVTAMRAGAFDFVVKPVAPERLRTAIANAVKVESHEDATRRRRKPSAGTLSFRDIVTSSPAMERVIRLGRKAAASDIPILIEGESGVGKELVARAIQGSGERRAKPFVTVNCGAIPDNLVESILFGHEKGAFTGASEKHAGKFVDAHTGTLFLDEIGDLPPDVQVKLLRAVQDGEIDPVGGRGTRKVDIRLISATNRDLMERVREGAFREDLFYRLNVFPVMVPPLRERREDIGPLVQHFIARYAPDSAQRINGISKRAMNLLESHDWPGNIRQLENAVFRAVVLCEGEVLTADEFPQIRAQVEGLDAELGPADDVEPAVAAEAPVAAAGNTRQVTAADGRAAATGRFGVVNALDERGNMRTLVDVEQEMIRMAIEHYDGQMSEVARRLGIGRSTLYRKLKEMGLDPTDRRSDGLASGEAIATGG